ncbi:signal recognition particle subunit SRP72 [Kwoniella mangroviensis CBS 10435]|uniref:Signal recognition particle subunit SRP72 n=1 Tax=Kwoniella mangroviensis CBS 10435 TaxID=1331196 RepID=A0A1B9IIT7_9TREE|nr:signal recognition particle subunit SRP72 [Kwoniella mangroviensis CBS 10435]
MSSAKVAPSKGRKTFTPRPARSAEERLPKLYRSLTDQVDDGYFTNAIKTCKKILILDPKSQAAYQTLLFLHLQTDDYSSAITLLDNAPKDSKDSFEFERAYCFYRLHREKEALSLIEGKEGRKIYHLEAQIKYRLGEYQRAQEIYDDLLVDVNSSSSEHSDILTNLNATTSHQTFSTSTYKSHLSTTDDLENSVPSLPTGWSKVPSTDKKSISANAPKTAPSSNAKATADKEKKGKDGEKKRKHKLPKGAVVGKPFTEDPERWIPLKQRASYISAQAKKKGGKESMGTGFTQGSTAQPSHTSGGGGGGGGGKNKKGKRK